MNENTLTIVFYIPDYDHCRELIGVFENDDAANTVIDDLTDYENKNPEFFVKREVQMNAVNKDMTI